MSVVAEKKEKELLEDEKKKISKESKETEFHCKICNKYYASYKSFGNHTRSYHSTNKEKSKCEFCGNCFTRKDNLQQHIRLFHSTIQTTFPCRNCGEVFTSRSICSKHRLQCKLNKKSSNFTTNPDERLKDISSERRNNNGRKIITEMHENNMVDTKRYAVYNPSPVHCVQIGINDRQNSIFKGNVNVNAIALTEKPYLVPTKKRGRKGSHRYGDKNNNNNNINNNNNSHNHENVNLTNGNVYENVEENKALDCNVCNITFLSEKDYLSHKPFCAQTDFA